MMSNGTDEQPQLPKLRVAGSNPVSRSELSNLFAIIEAAARAAGFDVTYEDGPENPAGIPVVDRNRQAIATAPDVSGCGPDTWTDEERRASDRIYADIESPPSASWQRTVIAELRAARDAGKAEALAERDAMRMTPADIGAWSPDERESVARIVWEGPRAKETLVGELRAAEARGRAAAYAERIDEIRLAVRNAECALVRARVAIDPITPTGE